MKIANQLLFTGVLLAGFLGWTNSAQAEQSYHDSVVILLDGSGSMDEPMGEGSGQKKIDAAKVALNVVVGKIPKTTHVGLLVFSNTVTDPWVYPLGPLDVNLFLERVKRVVADGGTPLNRYVAAAGDRLLEDKKSQFGYGKYQLVVVTDGEETESKENLERNTTDLVSRGIMLDVIGVAMKGGKDHSLAQYARIYRSASDPKSLTQAVSSLVAEKAAPSGTDNGPGGETVQFLDAMQPETAIAIINAYSDPTSTYHKIGTAPPQDESARRPEGVRPNSAAPNYNSQPQDLGCGVGGDAHNNYPFFTLEFLALFMIAVVVFRICHLFFRKRSK